MAFLPSLWDRDLVGLSYSSPVDEDSGDWFAGTQRLFAGVAAAAVLASSSSAAAQSQVRHGYSPDEVVTAPVFLPVEIYESTRPLPVPANRVQVFAGDEDFVPTAAVFTYVEDQWTVTIPAPARTPLQVFATEDELPVTAVVVVNVEDVWIPSAPPPPRLPVVFTTDDEYQPTLTVREIDGTPYPLPLVSRVQVFAGEDELPVAAAEPTITVEDAYLPLVSQKSRVRVVFAEDEIFVAPAAPTFFSQEDEWIARAVPVATRVTPAFAAEDELAALAIGEESFFPRSATPAVRAQLFAEQDELPVLAVIETDGAPVPLTPTPRVISATATDEVYVSPALQTVSPASVVATWVVPIPTVSTQGTGGSSVRIALASNTG